MSGDRLERLFCSGEFHVVYLDSEGQPMSSYEHRIVTAAIHLAEAEAKQDESGMAEAVVQIVQNARWLVTRRMSEQRKDGTT
jgi:hypothetical protein